MHTIIYPSSCDTTGAVHDHSIAGGVDTGSTRDIGIGTYMIGARTRIDVRYIETRSIVRPVTEIPVVMRRSVCIHTGEVQ